MFIKGKGFTDVYYQLVDCVMNQTQFESAPRGMAIKECIPVMFQIENPRDRLLYVPERKFSVSYMVAELLWYLLGENKTEWISNYASFWEGISDDGETANSAYGARIFKPHNYIADNAYTQWDYIKEELTKDRDSRRAVIHIRTPADSIHATKDVPCTLALQFFIRKSPVVDKATGNVHLSSNDASRDELHMVVNMRSSDLVLGISYDAPAFTMFQEILANELGVGLGTYTHISHSLHVYERHFEMCKKIMEGQFSGLIMPKPILGDPIKDYGPAMPIVPEYIPISELNELQWRARGANDEITLVQLFEGFTRCKLDRFWVDWGVILLRHRAQRLGCDSLVERCDYHIAFDGYREFEK